MLQQLAALDLFDGIPAADLQRLAAVSRPRRFRPGEAIIGSADPGAPFHLILRGRVQVDRIHAELTEAVPLYELGPGDLLGAPNPADGWDGRLTATALAETDTADLSSRTARLLFRLLMANLAGEELPAELGGPPAAEGSATYG